MYTVEVGIELGESSWAYLLNEKTWCNQMVLFLEKLNSAAEEKLQKLTLWWDY